MDIKEEDKTYVANTYARFDVTFLSGKGSSLFDDNGKEYIDFSSGIAVTGLGHANSKWLDRVKAQLDMLEHASNLYYTKPCAELARKLALRTGLKKVFFCNSGAEANECAIKTARKYAVENRCITKPEILTLNNSFHGRSLATLTATGQESLHQRGFAPYAEGFKYADPNMESVKDGINENTAAIMVELVQGEGGVLPLDKRFVAELFKYCRDRDILFICDEVQTGNGRTGTLYAYMQYGILPDILTTAKGLGNGLPIGACVFGEKTENTLKYGDHGSTFGANPVICAGALAVLDQLDEKLLDGVNERNKIIVESLKDCNGVKSVSGLGLMLGLEVDDAKNTAKECLQRGLVVLTAHDKLRILPPLNIEKEQLEKGLAILKEVLK